MSVISLRACGGLERMDFQSIPLWENMVVFKHFEFGEYVILKGVWGVMRRLIVNNFHFMKPW